jgi:FkbM family methyltransferase
MNADGATALPVDPASYGLRAPDPLVRVILGFTRSLPGNWVGFRISTPFRRIAINWLGERPVDTVLWGARFRLYPRDNSCEKNALFTPQAFDVRERTTLASAIDRRLAAGGTFTFVDIGANVGLYSLFVAARGGAHARIVAAEPQPGIVERLRFNLHCNPELNVSVAAVAVTDRAGEIELVIRRDRAGSYVAKGAAAVERADTVRVVCRPLVAILAEAGVNSIDALKIDIEGAEDLALAPFLREAPGGLLPRLILIEDRPDWTIDLYALIRQRGYTQAARTRHNIIFRLMP